MLARLHNARPLPICTAVHICSTRYVIKDPRLLFLVKCLYFSTPFLIGVPLLKYVTPDHDEMEEVCAQPSLSLSALHALMRVVHVVRSA